MNSFTKAAAPIMRAVLLTLLPAPEGLPQHAWYYTAIFARSS
ncbi:anion permease [Siccirubricoccus sp. G192]|nr:anion permease [Siccirubricoccus sp. G192]MBV1798935.1 anion permease [Siccirubricoccus sp. G192]